jgi:prepilin-type N-terminal cleavage/methylation domain-containing protein
MKILYKTKKAFTMLELVFVIAILGIVASISSGIIVQVYESYLMQRAVHNASIDTELAINQISNRLAYRINNSLLARKPGQTGLTDNDALPITALSGAVQLNTYTALEWITYDNGSFSATNPPAWSGYCDLTASSYASVVTPGSKLSNLGAGSYALVFLGDDYYRTDGGHYSDKRCMYHDDGCIFPVTTNGDTTLDFTGDGNRTNIGNIMQYTEFYQLAKTAYAVIPERDTTTGSLGAYGGSMLNGIEVWDLHLYADYQPWDNEDYKDGTDSTLIKNISVFRFKKESNSIRIKICKVVPIGNSSQVTICKEKAVIR